MSKNNFQNGIYPIQLDQIILFGDSITQKSFDPFLNGWGAFLADAYMRKLDVINRGMSGKIFKMLWDY